jgi:hypothetical protein
MHENVVNTCRVVRFAGSPYIAFLINIGSDTATQASEQKVAVHSKFSTFEQEGMRNILLKQKRELAVGFLSQVIVYLIIVPANLTSLFPKIGITLHMLSSPF